MHDVSKPSPSVRSWPQTWSVEIKSRRLPTPLPWHVRGSDPTDTWRRSLRTRRGGGRVDVECFFSATIDRGPKALFEGEGERDGRGRARALNDEGMDVDRDFSATILIKGDSPRCSFERALPREGKEVWGKNISATPLLVILGAGLKVGVGICAHRPRPSW